MLEGIIRQRKYAIAVAPVMPERSPRRVWADFQATLSSLGPNLSHWGESGPILVNNWLDRNWL
jgi:hypothetical protein